MFRGSKDNVHGRQQLLTAVKSKRKIAEVAAYLFTKTLINAMAKYGKKAQSKVERAMHGRKKGTLTMGRSGKKVKSRKQAIAIGLSEARKAGGKVPKKAAKKTARKAAKKSTRKVGRPAKKSRKTAKKTANKSSSRK